MFETIFFYKRNVPTTRGVFFTSSDLNDLLISSCAESPFIYPKLKNIHYKVYRSKRVMGFSEIDAYKRVYLRVV